MTSTAARPEGSLPIEPTAIVKAEGTEALKDVAYGSIAGALGKILEYPFDTVKVRLQSQPLHLPPLYTGPLDCFRKSFLADGLSGLYRGVSAPLVGAAVETSSLFWSYRIAQEVLLLLNHRGAEKETRKHSQTEKEKLGLRGLVACGAASGAFTSLLLTPIELVKCQMQVPGSGSSQLHRRRSSPLAVIADVFKHHGLLGFWHGQLGTLIRETGGSAAWFGAYEGVGALFRSYNHTLNNLAQEPNSVAAKSETLAIWQQLLAGASAGVSYNFVCFPADTIKSRMQTEAVNPVDLTSSNHNNRRATFWASGKELWRQQGLSGLYRGCGITVARAAPSSAVIFAVYEGLRGCG